MKGLGIISFELDISQILALELQGTLTVSNTSLSLISSLQETTNTIPVCDLTQYCIKTAARK